MAEQDRPLQYSDSGVNYDLMDPFKIACQKAGATTSENIERFQEFGLTVNEVTYSRGESAFRVRIQTHQPMTFEIAQVIEGLGSENAISQRMYDLMERLKVAREASQVLGKSFFRGASYDNASTVFNDLSSSGASPMSYLMFLATGGSEWYQDEQRYEDLIAGALEACDDTRSTWGGGESQTLVDMIEPNQIIMAGASVGLTLPEYVRYPSETNIREGLSIVLLETDNPQTNGYTGLRKKCLERLAARMRVSEKEELAYTYDIGNGQTYGEAILAKSKIATPIIDGLLLSQNPIPIEYATHLSGHAWRKLMRPNSEFTYVLDQIPDPHPIFRLIQDLSQASTEQMYADYNMGAYYALLVEPQFALAVTKEAKKHDQKALIAGYVEKGPKRVVIRPVGIEFKGESLQIR